MSAPLKVIFLDVDGVLNSHAWFKGHGHDRGLGHLDPEACARMQRLVERTDARIVVSSTWRLLHKLNALRSMFRARGLTGAVIGATPAHPRDVRGVEIQQWLDAARLTNTHPTNIVIVDDDSDMAHLAPWLVKTHFDRGFTEWELDRAVEMLERPGPEVRR